MEELENPATVNGGDYSAAFYAGAGLAFGAGMFLSGGWLIAAAGIGLASMVK